MKELLRFITNRIFLEIPLHEEYYAALNKIFTLKEGRAFFIAILDARFPYTQNYRYPLGKQAF